MTDFIITRPSRGSDTLHVAGCRNVHHRATVQTLAEAALGWYPTLWKRVDFDCVRTPGLETQACAQWDAAREEWEAEQARQKAEIDAHHYAQWLKHRADELEYLHSFLPLRDALRPLYPEAKVSASVSTSDWKMHPAVDLSPDVWSQRVSLYHDRATGRLSYDRVGNVNGLVTCAADAYRLGSALSIIENYTVTSF